MTGLLIDLDLQLHYITAGGSPHETRADGGIVLIERADVAGIVVVVDDVLMVGSEDTDGARS